MMIDITKRKEAENELIFHARLLNEINEAAIVTDLEGKITYWNRAAEKLYGWIRDEVLRKNIIDVTPTDTSKEEAEKIMEQLRHGDSWTGQFLVKRKDGSTFTALVSNSPVYNDDGKVTGIIGISTDITEKIDVEFKLRERIKEQQCLYNISQLDEQKLRIGELLKKAVNLIPKGFQNPENTAASIEWKDEVYSSENVEQKNLVLTELSRRFIKMPLIIRVYLLEEIHDSGESAILEEEKLLLKAIKDLLAVKIEKIIQKEELMNTLEEKDSLLMEIHHRVKNNLAVVSGLLEMQAIGTDNQELSDYLMKAVFRIKSMAILHEQLYQSGSFSKIRLSLTIKHLVQDLLASVQTDTKVNLEFDLEPVLINIYKGIPCCILVNEVVMNILDQGFTDNGRAKIKTSVSEVNGNVNVKIFADDFSLLDKFQKKELQFMGLKLTDMLTKQLDGENEFAKTENGMVFRLSFPKSDSQDKLNIFEN